MANLKEIRNRIGSVKSTRKITSAMSRIATARLRRAQNAMDAARDYGDRVAAVVREIMAELEDPASLHPFLATRPVEHVMIVVVTADRGLCGGFNSSILRASAKRVEHWRSAGKQVDLVLVGRKAEPLRRTSGIEPKARHPAPAIGRENTVVPLAKDVAAEALGGFAGTIDRVELAYNHFRSMILQEARVVQLLPFTTEREDEDDEDGDGDVRAEARHAVRSYEPDARALLEHLLPIAVETAVQQAYFNSAAAEIAARRQAMDSATDNATDLIGQLTLQYNRERQAAITKELMEIVGGAEALRG